MWDNPGQNLDRPFNQRRPMILPCELLTFLTLYKVPKGKRRFSNVIAQLVNPQINPPVFGDPDTVQVQGPRVLNVVTLAVSRSAFFLRICSVILVLTKFKYQRQVILYDWRHLPLNSTSPSIRILFVSFSSTSLTQMLRYPVME